MKRVNYFDLGLHTGLELWAILSEAFPSCNITNYRAYGFEACQKFIDINIDRYNHHQNFNVEIIHKAISNTEERIKLYHVDKEKQPGEVGHSIFRTKNNVTDEYEEIDSIIFSKWLKENVPSYKEDLNIMKVNIEGAEWHLFNDMVDNDLLQYFPIICGAGHDVDKVSELDADKYWKLIKDNDINVHRFCADWHPERNANIPELIREQCAS
jgi:FkbM family methyltransferase